MTGHALPGLAMILCISALLSGCSSGKAAPAGPPSLSQIASDARAHGHEWQADQLDDGDITLAEYDEGHRRNLACLDAAGITYSTPERNLVDGYQWLYKMQWPNLSEAKGQKVSQACFDDNVGDLALAMAAWGKLTTEPALLADVVKCVNGLGFKITPDVKNIRDVWLSGSDQGLKQEVVSTCAQNGMLRLHRGVDFAIGF
jgi:hypothetical protein